MYFSAGNKFLYKKLCVRQDQVLCQPPYKTSSYVRDNTSSTLGNHDESQRSPPSLDIYMCAETSNNLPLFVHVQRQPDEPSYHPTSLLSKLHHSPMFTDMIDWTIHDDAACTMLFSYAISGKELHFTEPLAFFNSHKNTKKTTDIHNTRKNRLCNKFSKYNRHIIRHYEQ